MNDTAKKEIINYIIDTISDYEGSAAEDLHNSLFNEDYYVIGCYQAEQLLIKWGGAFEAIGFVQQYEQENFGEVDTDLSSSEKVANTTAYIIGEEIIQNLETSLEGELTASKIESIKNELKEALK